MKLRTVLASLAILLFSTSVAIAAAQFNQVKPDEFDPARSFLVQAAWLSGIGCPTSQDIQRFAPPNFDTLETVTYADAGCPSGDAKDKHNEGLLLVKTGPTNDNASAVAELKGVKGMTLTELGYDIRNGSHCGAGAPRFNVTTSDGFWFVGCSSPPGVTTATSNGWRRLRWTPVTGYKDGVTLSAITGTVTSIEIVFDEGQDTDPIGLAILDNIDVNGMLVGHGPSDGD
jgi:hypothetical protein